VIQRLLLVFFLVLLAAESMAQVDSLLIQEGTASYYGRKFHGRKTASGEIFHLDSMTAAHKNLPWGTVIKVTNKKNGLSALVRINDRLPSYSKRQIDLSSAAAEQIEMIRDGLAQVRIEAVDLDQLDRLVEYFSDKDPSGLRIRPYYRSIAGPEREWDKSLKKVNPSPSSLLFD
jgi:rare lipoprotein A